MKKYLIILTISINNFPAVQIRDSETEG